MNIILLLVATWIFSLPAHSFENFSTNTKASSTAPITVSISQRPVGRSGHKFSNFLGVHSLFWETQKGLTDATGILNSDSIAILKHAGVRIIRNGGGVNELDWRQCSGPLEGRRPQKVATWIPPERCEFGTLEYEASLDRLGANTSWYIANIVGIEFKILPVSELAQSAADRAIFTRGAAGGRRHIYWELGNEVERGRYPWTESDISERMQAIGAAIVKADSSAKLVVPLLEYRPSNIENEYRYNSHIIRSMRNIASDYALHVYYENPPEGPSLRNRLNYISALVKQIRRLDPEGQLWITEHARWPKGSSKDGAAWRKNWSQTTDDEGVLSTAAFLVGLSQIDGVSGAMWHGLRAGPWNLVNLSNSGAVRPSPMATLFKLLHQQVGQLTPVAINTIPMLKNAMLMSGGIYVTAFADPRKRDTDLRVLVVNRSNEYASFALDIDKGLRPVSLVQSIHYAPARDIDVPAASVSSEITATDKASVILTAPGRSVSVFTLK